MKRHSTRSRRTALTPGSRGADLLSSGGECLRPDRPEDRSPGWCEPKPGLVYASHHESPAGG
jgi:hypothetical protein